MVRINPETERLVYKISQTTRARQEKESNISVLRFLLPLRETMIMANLIKENVL